MPAMRMSPRVRRGDREPPAEAFPHQPTMIAAGILS
jgi:hypothetical protein